MRKFIKFWKFVDQETWHEINIAYLVGLWGFKAFSTCTFDLKALNWYLKGRNFTEWKFWLNSQKWIPFLTPEHVSKLRGEKSLSKTFRSPKHLLPNPKLSLFGQCILKIVLHYENEYLVLRFLYVYLFAKIGQKHHQKCLISVQTAGKK